MKVLITGAAGFIGFHLAQRLLQDGFQVVGIDNLNAYYEVALKKDRLEHLLPHASFTFECLDVSDRQGLFDLFGTHRFDRVVHLAAQAGVRYSLEAPFAYVDSNLVGFANMLEAVRQHKTPHLVYASSSSVYGTNQKIPFAVEDRVDHPISLYAATKKANELMAHSYSHLYNLPTTGLRFFTVYGPWGRPDMAYFKFVQAILQGKPIDVYNFGRMQRDFTYIDDVVEGIVRVMHHLPTQHLDPETQTLSAPYKIYNIGNNTPVALLDFIEAIASELGREVQKNLLPLQPGDVVSTYADITELEADVGYKPSTPIAEGIRKFVGWYREYYQV
ncbi:MAG TPA: NAD-dependent epimerase [Stenomitos sp.]